MSLFALVRNPKKCEQKCEYSHSLLKCTIVCTQILNSLRVVDREEEGHRDHDVGADDGGAVGYGDG